MSYLGWVPVERARRVAVLAADSAAATAEYHHAVAFLPFLARSVAAKPILQYWLEFTGNGHSLIQSKSESVDETTRDHAWNDNDLYNETR